MKQMRRLAHLAFLCEFDSVVQNVQQNLLQALRILAQDLRHVLRNVVSHLKSKAACGYSPPEAGSATCASIARSHSHAAHTHSA